MLGAQTSGLTLAIRLSEDPSISVLVLEAGQANLDDPDIRSYSRIFISIYFAQHLKKCQ
jgi:choline dehydrogenase-like flavoprotein